MIKNPPAKQEPLKISWRGDGYYSIILAWSRQSSLAGTTVHGITKSQTLLSN